MGGTLIGRTVEEQGDGVILEYPGMYTEAFSPVGGGDSFNRIARIEPFGNVRDNYRYKLYYSAVRGEVYSYNPKIRALYDQFVEWSRAGRFDTPRPEVNLTEEKTNADDSSSGDQQPATE